MKFNVFLLSALFLSGCAVAPHKTHTDQASFQTPVEQISVSLFKSDNENISNEAAEKILNGKVTFPMGSKAALLKLPSNSMGIRYYGYNYWRSESYIDLQQQYVDVLTENLESTQQIDSVVALPSFMIGKEMSLSQMREAAVRMQSHILVVYNIHSNIFEEYRLFRNNKVKAFSTCEAAVLDTKTGILPYTKVLTEKLVVEANSKDTDMAETRKRAEISASKTCLNKLGKEIGKYLGRL